MLSGANLTEIEHGGANFDGVHANAATIWPDAFDHHQFDLFIESD
jgi:hypothetical protein